MTIDHPDHDRPDNHDDFGGLHRDLNQPVDRRRALQWFGGVGLAGLLAACGSSGSTDGAATPSSTAAAADGAATTSSTGSGTEVPAGSGAGAEIPDETAGPFPADGTNGPNLLSENGIVRADITNSIGPLSGRAEGVPTTFQLTVVDAATGDPLPGAAVYIWHCTADGQYSMYEIGDQNFLRGVQVADAAGKVSFASVFPGCYRGRWPHCHFEIYDTVDAATADSQAIKTSQLALPQADCEAIYTDDRYPNSTQNLAALSLAGDNVFSDGWQDQLATVAGAAADGVTASLLVRV